MILSHHGELAFGSPKVPLFPEALLLHHLDNLDSKIECMRGLLERDRSVEGMWTAYCPPLDRSVLKKRKFLDSEKDPPQDKTECAPPRPQPAKLVIDSSSPFASKLQDALRTRD